MKIETLHTDLRGALMRGTSQDGKLARWVREAVNWLEINQDFQYMRQVADVTIDPMAETPEVIELPNARVKYVEMVREYIAGAVDRTRSYNEPLVMVDQRTVTGLGTGALTGYWMDGTDAIVLDAIPQTAVTLELIYYEYTDWPEDDQAEPSILQRYNVLVFRQAMLQAAVELKDNRMAAEWKGMRDEALAVVIAAEEALKYKGRRLVMGGYRARRA